MYCCVLCDSSLCPIYAQISPNGPSIDIFDTYLNTVQYLFLISSLNVKTTVLNGCIAVYCRICPYAQIGYKLAQNGPKWAQNCHFWFVFENRWNRHIFFCIVEFVFRPKLVKTDPNLTFFNFGFSSWVWWNLDAMFLV